MKKILILFMLMAIITGVSLYSSSQTGGSRLISPSQAIEKTKELPEVKNYIVRVPNGKIEVDNETEAEYTIHVYEVLNNHTATFNWYVADKKTGEISPM